MAGMWKTGGESSLEVATAFDQVVRHGFADPLGEADEVVGGGGRGVAIVAGLEKGERLDKRRLGIILYQRSILAGKCNQS